LSTMSGLQPLTTEVFYAENNFVFFWKKHPSYKILRVVSVYLNSK
jgi:hypothetical protein